MVLDERRSMIVQQCRDAEDAGLFKAGINKIVIDVIPELRRNNRKDLVVTGFVRGTEVEVLFAGRRRADTLELCRRLKQLRIADHPPKRIHTRKSEDCVPNEAPAMPLALEGAWRPRYWYDHEGSVHRVYQFIAARWIFISSCGQQQMFGVPSIAHADQAPPK